MKITKMNNPKKITDKSGQALKGQFVAMVSIRSVKKSSLKSISITKFLKPHFLIIPRKFPL